MDLAGLSVQTLLIYLILMWIGGGSQSTAGGIKVNAFAVVVLNLVAVLRGTERVEVFDANCLTTPSAVLMLRW